MAQDNILAIVRTVAGRVGLNKPNTVTGSTDVGVVQLWDLANEEGQELAARYDWQVLVREKTFATIAAEDQGKLVGDPSHTILSAADGFRKILNDTIFDRSQRVQVTGPMSPRVYAAYKGTTAMNGFYSQYRLRGGRLLLYPAPSAGRQYAFEYISENWVTSSAGDAFRNKFTQDEDIPLLDSNIITMGLLWRWKAAKGLEYAEDYNKYEARVLDAMTEDKTTRAVSLDGSNKDGADPFILVQRGNWSL